MEDFQAWSLRVFAISVGLAVLAAGWTARVRTEPRPTLPLAHVAGAALAGTLGWEALNQLPGTISSLWLATAGVPVPPLVTVALLAWPFVQRSSVAAAPPGADEWTPTAPEPEAGR